MLVWIQISVEYVREYLRGKHKEEGKDYFFEIVMRKGRTYVSNDGIKIIDFHVDSIIDEFFATLQKNIDEAEEISGGLGTKQSEFRKDKIRKPLLMFGKDEWIFKQFLLNKKAWKGKDGRFSCRPKDDGHGVMASALQNQKISFGCPIFEEVKEQVKKIERENIIRTSYLQRR